MPTDPRDFLAMVIVLAAIALTTLFFTRSSRPSSQPLPYHRGLRDDEGHRRADPPINLKALDAAVSQGE